MPPWYPDTNPMLGIAQTVGTIQRNQLIPLEAQTMQLGIQTGQQALAQARADSLGHMFAATSDPTEIPGALSRAIQAHLIDPGEAAALTAGGAPAWNMLRTQAIARYGTAAEQSEVFPTPVTRETGGQTLTYGETVNPNTGVNLAAATGPGAAVNKVLTPEEEAGGVTYIGADNAQHSIPTSKIRTPTGQPIPNVRAPDGTQITDANGALVAGLQPGVEAQAAAAATGGVSQGLAVQGNIVNAANNSQYRKGLLGTVIGLSKEVSTGPNAEFWKGMGELASEYGVDPKSLGVPWDAPGQAAAMEALDKLSWQVAQQQFQVLGGTGSNMQLDSAIHTSPNSGMTAQGIRNIAGFLQGNEDAIQAENKALIKWNSMPQHKGHPESLINFPSVWNSVYDPRAFQFKYEDAAGQKAILGGMSANEQAEFKRRQRLLTDMGYLTP